MTHHFDTEHAERYGLVEAVLLQNLAFWIAKNRADRKHRHDGRTWTYNSVTAFAELFPYLTRKQIRRALERLEAEGVVVTGNYNRSPIDRTTWYALADESAFLGELADLPSGANAFARKGRCNRPQGQMHLPAGADQYQIETQIENTDGGARGGDGHDVLPSLAVPPGARVGTGRADEPAGDGAADGPTLEDVLAFARIRGVRADVAEGFFWFYDAEGWRVNGRPIRRWESKLMGWKNRQPAFDRKGRPATGAVVASAQEATTSAIDRRFS